MNKQDKKIASENMSMNFGGRGWWVIIYQALMFFFLIGFSIDGLNIVAPAFSEATGINYPSVLSMATVAGMIGVVAYIVIAQINVKVGARLLSGVCLIGAGLSYIFLGHSTTLVTYCVALTLVTCFINGAAYIAGNTLIAQWFPKKKGLANGFTTMGHNCGSAFYVPLVSMMIATFGFANGLSYLAIGAIVLGIVGLLTIRSKPQECGRNTGLGFTQEAATGLMTVCALIGVVGSYLFGAIDQKFGVKKAILLFLAWYCVALAINCTDTTMGVYISVAMIGIAVGAAANFIVSLPASVFGRHGFTLVNSVFFPLMQIVLMTNYVVNAAALQITGSLRGAYFVYIGLLVVNMLITLCINPTKYNKDYAVEDQLKKG